MTDLAPHHDGGQPRGSVFDTAPADRTRDFEKARRHSRNVRTLRLALPMITFGMIGLYVFSVLRTAGVGEDIVAVTLPKILPTDLVMQNPHYEGYAEDGSMYKVRAVSAKPNLKNTNLINLTGISAELIDTQKKTTTLTAKSGLYDSKNSQLTLSDNILVKGEDGLQAKLSRADVFTKTSVIQSLQPVEVEFAAGAVRSDKMVLQQKQKHVRFSQNVKANLKPPAQKASKKSVSASANQMFVGSDKPVTITSQSLDIFDGDKRAVFEGTVVAQQGLARLTTPSLEASYDTAAASQSGDKAEPSSTSLMSGGQGKLRRILAKGPVVMTQGPRDRVTCNAADFDAINETAILSGNVVMTSGPGRRARSDRVDLDQLRERAILTGNVVVSQDQNVLKGRRLEIDQRSAITKLTSPAGVGYGPGRISAHFVQNQAQKKARTVRKTKKTGPFRADPGAPLDITASQLVVKDKAKIAIFTGGVKARQGAFRIATAELQALYKGSAALGDVSSRGRNPAGGTTSLTHIKARRDVVITGNDGQRVKGDWADFDVTSGKATVGGRVEIQQGGNVIHGTRLTIDTKTGRTIIETAPSNTVARPQGGGWVTSNRGGSRQTATPGNQGRPSAIFYLNDIDKARAKQKRGAAPNVGSAWQPRSAP